MGNLKSIKEKAHEIGWVSSQNYDPNVCKQEWCEIAARAGANHVLKQFEEFQNYFATCMTSTAREHLNNIIEQLKK